MTKVIQGAAVLIVALLLLVAWMVGLLGDTPLRDAQGRTIIRQFWDERDNSPALSTCYRANEPGQGYLQLFVLKREGDHLHGAVAIENNGQVGTGTFDSQANGNDFEGSIEANGRTTSVQGSYTKKRMLLVIPQASKDQIVLGICEG
jgi:hypothetical protein